VPKTEQPQSIKHSSHTWIFREYRVLDTKVYNTSIIPGLQGKGPTWPNQNKILKRTKLKLLGL